YGGLFRVDKDGKVYRHHGENYVLAPQCKTAKNGKYLVVAATVDGKQKNFLVHRLVAMAYIPNPENKPEVNHEDGNGHNNHVENLKWATRKENVEHACKNGLMRSIATRGIPCICCGSLTLSKDRVCRPCKVESKIIERRASVVERKAETIGIVLDEIDIEKISERNLDILKLYSRGVTLQGIGDRHSITRERVRKIIDRYVNFRSKDKPITEQQKQLAAYIEDMGFKQSHLAGRIGISYYILRQMLSLNKHMPENVYEPLSAFVKFEYNPSVNSALQTLDNSTQAS
ncbi:MAG: HNH endonuclease, partial [Sporomusa sp.]